MANERKSKAGPGNGDGNDNVPGFTPGKASDSVISLSQAILSPLDALFKAQIHAARSFLNLILQIGYPNIRINKETMLPLQEDLQDENRNKPFYIPFNHIVSDNNGNSAKYDISIPALALIPFNSLAIDSGEFKFGMNISYIDNHQQVQDSRIADGDDPDGKRPWFLVKDPISMKGNITSSAGAKTGSSQETTIDIVIKVSKSPLPAALDNLLTHLTQQTLINTSPPTGSVVPPAEIKTPPPAPKTP
ncbi:DUF2589 domain-containing protein [Flavitalea flava]